MKHAGRPLAIIGGKLIRNDKIQENEVILIESGKIKAICGHNDFSHGSYEHIDASGCFVTPGLVDLHVHGCLHHTFNEPSAKAFELILTKMLSAGVTTLAPTLVAAPIPELDETLAFIGEWKRNQTSGMTAICGAYLESPFIAPIAKGALPESAIRNIQKDDLDLLLNHQNALSVFMIAPELPGAPEAFRKITAHGIVGAMGHSMAIEEQIQPAIDAGASHVTHLWSAMSSTVRHGPWRKPGLLEVALTHPELTAEIIADNRHLPPTLMKLAIQSKKWNASLCAVSDALNGAGLEEGEYFCVGDNRYQVVDGVGMVEDRTVFAGSTTLLNQEIPILTDIVGLRLPEVIAMVTEVPSKILKIDHKKGKIATDYNADLVLFNPDFTPRTVIQNGIVVSE